MQDWPTAAAHLADLKAAGASADRINELEAQMAAVRRDMVSATVEYTALALARQGEYGADHPDTRRAADQAQAAWLRIGPGEQDRAVQAGKALLSLRGLVPSDSQDVARIRAGLARLHLS
ncbi:hypothetical protein ACFYUY_23725 [Kitasatospora sp. NPDC004745]|uniref:hypothetical protein n=1 Tax=Kitasatospora sp. NPDC004745 TaxID=3364019 RepID=UPI0036949BB1